MYVCVFGAIASAANSEEIVQDLRRIRDLGAYIGGLYPGRLMHLDAHTLQGVHHTRKNLHLSEDGEHRRMLMEIVVKVSD